MLCRISLITYKIYFAHFIGKWISLEHGTSCTTLSGPFVGYNAQVVNSLFMKSLGAVNHCWLLCIPEAAIPALSINIKKMFLSNSGKLNWNWKANDAHRRSQLWLNLQDVWLIHQGSAQFIHCGSLWARVSLDSLGK